MNYPQRKHPRLPQYDYSAAGGYFLTICTKEKRCILGTVGRDDLGAPWQESQRMQFAQFFEGAQIRIYVEILVVIPRKAIMAG